MATVVTGLTAARMQQIEAASIVDGEIVNGNLILTRYDGGQINAGPVIGPAGPAGPQGSSAIPGEIKVWSGAVLPDPSVYKTWTWANGDIFNNADWPLAAANIASAWKTAFGQADPGAGKFRVPDFRGMVPAGLDAMPVTGPRANRLTRAVAIQLATKTGEETHVVTVNEMPAHNHALTVRGNQGPVGEKFLSYHNLSQVLGTIFPDDVAATGGSQPHENVQPTVMVPYIVFLG